MNGKNKTDALEKLCSASRTKPLQAWTDYSCMKVWSDNPTVRYFDRKYFITNEMLS